MAKKSAKQTEQPASKAPAKRGPNVTDVVDVGLSRCRKCQCTERSPYTNTTEREIGGVTADGRPYTHILWRSTKCLNCGQCRRDRCFENRRSGG
jgi:hypothetical protein